MSDSLYQFMAEDHVRLDGLLQRAVAKPGVLDADPIMSSARASCGISRWRRRLSYPPSQDGKGARSQQFGRSCGLTTGRWFRSSPSADALNHASNPVDS